MIEKIEHQALQITDTIPIEYQYIANLVFILLIFMLLWAIFKLLIYRRYQVGNLLLKLPLRGQSTVIFVYSIIILNTVLPFLEEEKLFAYPIENLTRLLFSIYLLLRLLMNNPPSIREKGILTTGGLATWEQINYYQWSINIMKPDEHILIVSTGTFFWDIWKLTIKNTQKNSVDSLLQEYLILDK